MNFKKNQKNRQKLSDFQKESGNIVLEKEQLTKVYGGDVLLGYHLTMFTLDVVNSVAEWLEGDDH